MTLAISRSCSGRQVEALGDAAGHHPAGLVGGGDGGLAADALLADLAQRRLGGPRPAVGLGLALFGLDQSFGGLAPRRFRRLDAVEQVGAATREGVGQAGQPGDLVGAEHTQLNEATT